MYVRRRSHSILSRLARLLTLITILWVCAFFMVRHTQNSNKIISPLADDFVPESQPNIFSIFRREKDPDKLKLLVKTMIGNNWNNYSVYVLDLNSKFTMGINESTIYSAASVNKIPILATLYAQTAQGKVDFDRIITVQEKDIQDYGTGSIRYDGAGSTYSIKTLARLMMQKSDNTAAYLLGTEILGLPAIQTYINGLGLTQTNMNQNKTSNKDMALLMEKIYARKLTSAGESAEMLDFMKDSDFEDRIPGLLPKDVTVYHKIGTGVGAVHDVGIVEHGKTKYYVGFFTSDITDEEQAAKLLSEVSKTIFDFMDGN
jgi:beta-lactamase class A